MAHTNECVAVCVIALEGRGGRRLRIEVAGVTVADLVTLTQVAWGRDG